MVFLTAMAFINFGRNSIAIIQVQYLVLETGFSVSSQLLSYIVNSHSVAMIVAGILSGWIGKRLGNGNALIAAAAVVTIALLLIAWADRLFLIFFGNLLRGFSEVIILAASYAYASVLIPPKNRARLFGMFNATFFLSWGIAATLVAGPIIDTMLVYGASEVFAYRMSFVAAAAITLTGILIMIGLTIYSKRKSVYGK
jgi:MFS family permease